MLPTKQATHNEHMCCTTCMHYVKLGEEPKGEMCHDASIRVLPVLTLFALSLYAFPLSQYICVDVTLAEDRKKQSQRAPQESSPSLT